MKNNNRVYDFITNGNKTYQFKDSMYGERIGDIEEGNGIATYNGKNYKALILTSDGQCGAVCSEYDLDLEEEE